MAMVMDPQQQQQQQPQPQQQTYKHYCRICKKGFGCGRALGGHMRAHGIHDDPITTDNNDPSGCSEWAPPGNKRMYALRANPHRLKNCRVCENCGKEFVSWKSFLDHGKCSSDDDAYYYEPMSDADDDELRGWSKGKRSRRGKSACTSTSEEEDLANCLVMLSSARVETITVEAESACASADKFKNPVPPPPPVPKGMFECKACKKVFTSHQALGGHRASHKKVKGCFAAKMEDEAPPPPPPEEDAIDHDSMINQETAAAAAAALAMAIVPFEAVVPLKKKSKVHECSICHRQFASGQALGGHKRCHWITSNSPDPMQDPTNHRNSELTLMRPVFGPTDRIDLNLPAPGSLYLWNVEEGKNVNINHEEGGCSVNIVKLAKLSELKDGGEATPWLQVGIGSSENEGSEQ